jgi:hypothetical protein
VFSAVWGISLELGHVKMGNFMFISWVLHMLMLIFFSYIIGVKIIKKQIISYLLLEKDCFHKRLNTQG